MDNGKPIRETKAADIPLAIDHFRYFASVIRGEEGSATMLDPNTLSLILREPIGVVAQIVPWNFPFLMAAWKLAPAIAAGNTILFKPSSTTSLSVLELARLVHDVLPAGVLNVITGSGSKAGVFVQQADIDKIAFTGSTSVGREIGLGAAKKIIPPSIGLHQRDNERLLNTLRHLTDIGNTLIVVEHDEDTMRVADHIVDIGPGAGVNGGEVADKDSNATPSNASLDHGTHVAGIG